MKKFLIAIIVFLLLLPAAFAKSDYYEFEESPKKIFGIAPGLRLSIIGLEPTLAIDFFNLEIEAGCAVSTGLDGKSLGIAPSLSLGYCTNPFERGSSTTFGAEYYLLSPSYTNLMNQLSEDRTPTNGASIHAFSLFYKGAFHFNRHLGLLWRIRLPLFFGGDGQYFNITNPPGALLCCLAGIATVGVGVSFMF